MSLVKHGWWIPVILSTLIGFAHLGHYGWTDIDEIIHSVVAANLDQHWLTPILHETVIGKPSYEWGLTHIWLHKPILPLWMSALSMELLGDTPFAFRLPSLLLHLGTIIMVHQTGARLYGSWTGLVAAGLAAILPFTYALLYGGQFCDIYDIGLAFWTAMGIYLFVRAVTSGRTLFYVLLGLSTGLGYHTKWEMGLFPLGLVLSFYALKHVPRSPVVLQGIRLRHVLSTLGCAALVIVPWMTYLALRFPIEHSLEHGVILAHLSGDIEGWSRPWYQHLWPYLAFQYTPVFAAVIYLATAVTLANLARTRSFPDLLCIVGLLGVFVTLSLATSKVPAGTHMIYPLIVVMVARVAVLAWSRLPRLRLLLLVAYPSLLASPVTATVDLIRGADQAGLREGPGLITVDNDYQPVPVYGIAMQIGQMPAFEGAYFLFHSDHSDSERILDLVDEYQLMFFTGRGAHRVDLDTELEPLVQEIRDKGLRPFLISTGRWLELPVVLAPEDSLYTVYDPTRRVD